MHFGDERAGSVYDAQVFVFGQLHDCRRNPVRAEDADRAVGHFFETIDKDNVALAEIIDHIAVVNDFMKDVNRRWEEIERAFDNVNGANHASAKSARLCQHYFLDRHAIFLRQKICRPAVGRQKAKGKRQKAKVVIAAACALASLLAR